jgi:hypothetical protein
MRKFIYGFVMLALIIGILPRSAAAEGRIVAYFNANGTQRKRLSPGVGAFTVMHIYGEKFDADFITGLQYKVDYGPQLNFIADLGLPAVAIGTSATGISVGFGAPRPGGKFVIHQALVEWNSDCSTIQNQDIWTGAHPDFPDPTPIVTRYPDFDIITAAATRSQTCQMVEMDVNPSHCPNTLNSTTWGYIGSTEWWKGGLLSVAILGSSTVNVNNIVKSSIKLNGVAPMAWPQTTWFDVSRVDGDNNCACDFVPVSNGDGEDVNDLINYNPDGKKDLLIFFQRTAIAAAIGAEPPSDGVVVTLKLTAEYPDGMPIEATDCVTIVGGGPRAGISPDDGGDEVSAGLGLPTPNPFNPVTRIGYNLPSTQHVRIAVYDVAGRLVENLVNEVKAPGDYVVEWNAGNLPSGVYFYRMQTGSQTLVRRATLLK